ncbi:MAG: hypothetical protein V1766_12290, partial [Pseudomonadota bacterium]
GGIITISAIGAAVATAAIAKATETGTAGAAGGAGTGTGGGAAAAGGGAAAAKTGLSTAAIAGIAIGGAATVGVAAAAIGSSGGGGSSTPAPAPTPTAQCNQQQVAGGDTADSRTIEMGKTSGTFRFYYNTYSQKDRIVLSCYGGSALYDTGCVGTSQTVSLPFSCSTSKITVAVSPNCAGGSGTAWNYTVYCP